MTTLWITLNHIIHLLQKALSEGSWKHGYLSVILGAFMLSLAVQFINIFLFMGKKYERLILFSAEIRNLWQRGSPLDVWTCLHHFSRHSFLLEQRMFWAITNTKLRFDKLSRHSMSYVCEKNDQNLHFTYELVMQPCLICPPFGFFFKYKYVLSAVNETSKCI